MKLMESGLHSPGSVAKWKDQPNSIHGARMLAARSTEMADPREMPRCNPVSDLNYCKGVCKNIDAFSYRMGGYGSAMCYLCRKTLIYQQSYDNHMNIHAGDPQVDVSVSENNRWY